MKKLLTLIVASLISLGLNAQAPSWLWAKSFGSTGSESAYAITTDINGNIYSTGKFSGTVDFDPGPGVYNLTASSAMGGFVLKLDAYGNFIWARVFTGAFGSCEGNAIDVDAAGAVYTSGKLYGTVDFDPGSGVYDLAASTNPDIYISKLDAAGNFLWAGAILGASASGNPPVLSLVIDDVTGDLYTSGPFAGTVDFDPSSGGVFNLTTTGGDDVFIAKYSAGGNLIWAKMIGGATDDTPHGIALDPLGHVYCTGRFEGTVDVDPGAGITNLIAAGSGDVFVVKLHSSGSFLWGKRLGGTSLDIVYALTSDQVGNVYTTGDFAGTADFDPGVGTSNITAVGSDDYFVSKLDSAGGFVWAKAFGGSGIPVSHAIAVDSSQNVYTTGYFAGTSDFDPGPGVYSLSPAGSFDVFVCKQNSAGDLDWVKKAGGSSTDNNFAATFNHSQNGVIYVAGDFYSPTCSFDSNVLTNAGSSDITIAKLGGCSAYFTISPDTAPGYWIGHNLAEGVQPLTYIWNWGDGSSTSTGPTPSHTYASPGYYNICLSITDATGCSATYCDSSTYLFRGSSSSSIVTVNFVVGSTVGLFENSLVENSISVHPNPARSFFIVDGLAEGDKLSVVNLMGEELIIPGSTIRSELNSGLQELQVESSTWRSGVYLVKVLTKRGLVVKKVVLY